MICFLARVRRGVILDDKTRGRKLALKATRFVRTAPEKETHWQRYSVRRVSGSRQHALQSILHQVAFFAHVYPGASESTDKAENHEIRGVRGHEGRSWGLQTVSMGAKRFRKRCHYDFHIETAARLEKLNFVRRRDAKFEKGVSAYVAAKYFVLSRLFYSVLLYSAFNH